MTEKKECRFCGHNYDPDKSGADDNENYCDQDCQDTDLG